MESVFRRTSGAGHPYLSGIGDRDYGRLTVSRKAVAKCVGWLRIVAIISVSRLRSHPAEQNKHFRFMPFRNVPRDRWFPVDQIFSLDLPELPTANLRYTVSFTKENFFDMAGRVPSRTSSREKWRTICLACMSKR